MTSTIKDNLGREMTQEEAIGTIWYCTKSGFITLFCKNDNNETYGFLVLSKTSESYPPGHITVMAHKATFENAICLGKIEDLDIESFLAERLPNVN